MTAEIDQAIKGKYLHHQDLQIRMDGLRQKWSNHDKRIESLPPGLKSVIGFLDGFRSPEGYDKIMIWRQETMQLFREVTELIKNNPGIYELTHLTYSPYTARDLGFPEFSYGFRFTLDGKELEKPFNQPVLFWGNGIRVRRAEKSTPLLEIKENEPPVLHIPEGFALIITKYKAITDFDINPDEAEKVYAAWQPEVTYLPKAIKVDEDAVIPWKNSVEEAEVFKGTVEVANLEFR